MPFSRPVIVRTVEQLRRHVGTWRAQGLLTALVPTMGALHAGHDRLVAEGLRRADRVIVTIFVNPRQFAPTEDLARYPRDEAGDREKLRQAGAHLVFVPDNAQMYPPDFATTVTPAGPAKAGLEDRFRKHFFAGVATVVAKLFAQAACDYAMFGEKDFQQLKVVSRMARDLDIATTVIAVQTVREADGLALSSRNAFLSPAERQIAPALHGALQDAATAIRAGTSPAAAVRHARAVLKDAGFRVDYVAARNADTLARLEAPSEPVRLLAAAWLGNTRLIDNVGV